MTRWLCALLAIILPGPVARAHFIWILPPASAAADARMIFSDNLLPDKPALLVKIAQIPLYLRDGSGHETPIKTGDGADCVLVPVAGKGPRSVGGYLLRGVHFEPHIDNGKPFLVNYYPKLILGTDSLTVPMKPWPALKMEILPTLAGDELRLDVLFQGKPAAKAQVGLLEPGTEKAKTFATDEAGQLMLKLTKNGIYGIRARHIEPIAGEHEGKKYEDTRHYATLVMELKVAQK